MSDAAPTNDITELRSLLFDTLRSLKDKDKPMDIDRAKAVADIAQTIINSAKVEVEHIKVSGGSGSGFIPDTKVMGGLPDGTAVVGHKPGLVVTRHKLKG